jgi:enoyl-CoA hydratase/carnithine racemase
VPVIEREIATDGVGVITLNRPEKLRWIVGDGRARELCLTGRRIDAAEAVHIGLVSRVVEPGHALDEALGIARDLAAVPERCLATTKRYLTGNAGLGFEDSFRVEHDDVFRAQIEAAALWQATEPS